MDDGRAIVANSSRVSEGIHARTLYVDVFNQLISALPYLRRARLVGARFAAL